MSAEYVIADEALVKERDEARAERDQADRDRAQAIMGRAELLLRAEKAEAEVAALKAVGFKILAKLDHPTASVTQWDVDELREALGGDAS